MFNILQGISITLLSSGFLFSTNFLASVLLAPSAYGELSALVYTITLMGTFLSSGMSFYILSIGDKNKLQACFDFAIIFFIASFTFISIALYIYNETVTDTAVATALYTYPAAASIGFCLIIVGYFQLKEDHFLSAAISSVPNLIKSTVILYALLPTLWIINDTYSYQATGTFLHLALFFILILTAWRYREKAPKEQLTHNISLATKYVFSNILVSAYTSMLIPVIYSVYGADQSAAFSLYFIFWSILNTISGYLYNNHYLIRLKSLHLLNTNCRPLFIRAIKTSIIIGFFVTASSIITFRLGSTNFWSEYASHQTIVIFLLCALGFRSVSAASGLFLSLGDWVKWKNLAQTAFLTLIYIPISCGKDFNFFAMSYFFAEFTLMAMYFLAAYTRVNTAPPTG